MPGELWRRWSSGSDVQPEHRGLQLRLHSGLRWRLYRLPDVQPDRLRVSVRDERVLRAGLHVPELGRRLRLRLQHRRAQLRQRLQRGSVLLLLRVQVELRRLPDQRDVQHVDVSVLGNHRLTTGDSGVRCGAHPGRGGSIDSKRTSASYDVRPDEQSGHVERVRSTTEAAASKLRRGGRRHEGLLGAVRACALLTVITAVPACSVARVHIPPPSGETITIFVPGYRGSILVDADRKKIAWVSPGDITGLSRKTLARPFEGMDEVSHFEHVTVGQPLTRLSILRGLVREEVYASFMEWGVQNLPGFAVFGYDWRQDVRETARQLCAFKDQLVKANGPQTKVRIVAHSMGGLVAMHCLSNSHWAGAANVDRLVLFGTPFGGAPGIFDDLMEGTAVGLNRRLLSKETLFTFESAWQLLPRQPTFFFDAQGRAVDVRAYEVNAWVSSKVGVFEEIARASDARYRAQFEHLVQANKDHHATLASMSGPPTSLRTFAVIGTGFQTTSGFQVAGSTLMVEKILHADGDGTVLTADAQPLPVLGAKTVTTPTDHLAMLRDPTSLLAMKAFLEAE